jgi:hypothetical protein
MGSTASSAMQRQQRVQQMSGNQPSPSTRSYRCAMHFTLPCRLPRLYLVALINARLYETLVPAWRVAAQHCSSSQGRSTALGSASAMCFCARVWSLEAGCSGRTRTGAAVWSHQDAVKTGRCASYIAWIVAGLCAHVCSSLEL